MQNIKTIELEKFIDSYFSNKESVRILDAGCGSVNNIKINKKKHITGIDISEKQLQRNKHLDKRILGDLEEYKYDNLIFDIIVCWDVLEHLKNPLKALDNFVKAIDDGIIILKLPNVYSLKGLITKFTPYLFHRFIYRNIFKSKKIHREDGGPFKTFLKFSISLKSLKKYADKNNLDVVFETTYDFGDIWNPIAGSYKGKIYMWIKKIIQNLSLGKISDSELILVLKKFQ